MSGPKDENIQTLFTQEQIHNRVKILAQKLSEEYKDMDSPPVFVGVLTGAFIFLSDLVRELTIPHEIDFIACSSYDGGTESSGTVQIWKDMKISPKQRHIILVEDIVGEWKFSL